MGCPRCNGSGWDCAACKDSGWVSYAQGTELHRQIRAEERALAHEQMQRAIQRQQATQNRGIGFQYYPDDFHGY